MGVWGERLDGWMREPDMSIPCVQSLRLPKLSGWEPGRIWTEWTVDPQFLQRRDAVFGGYLGALADWATGQAAMTTLADDETFTTADLRLSFHRAIREGSIGIEAIVRHRGRRTVHVDANFCLPNGDLAATATALQLVRPV